MRVGLQALRGLGPKSDHAMALRYGGRGIMIYWHVERKSLCIHSQLKSPASSEVAAMIEGVIRHCTEMSIDRQYVDSQGTSQA
jgi:TnpA family transposase